MKNFNAFTLAEVLITLGIIGVVAAVTMPTLISNYKKHVVETRLKQEVSLIQNAVRMAEAKHGFTNEWPNCSVTEEGNDNFVYECTENILKTYLAPELKILKICKRNDFETCWTTPRALTSEKREYLIKNSSSGEVAAILSNGSSIYMWQGGMSKSATSSPHIQLWFDIDGPNKGFERLGGDVFGGRLNFYDSKGYKLTGIGNTIETLRNNTTDGCSENSIGYLAGRYCGALIQANGWKIPKDYPIRF